MTPEIYKIIYTSEVVKDSLGLKVPVQEWCWSSLWKQMFWHMMGSGDWWIPTQRASYVEWMAIKAENIPVL